MKRLTKSSSSRILTGVCGGVADYLNVDPTVVRVVTAFGTIFTGGLALVGYIVCAAIMPQSMPNHHMYHDRHAPHNQHQHQHNDQHNI